MVERPRYGVVCTRSGARWSAEVPALGITTRVRRLDQVEAEVWKAIAGLGDAGGPERFDVEIGFDVEIESVRLVTGPDYSPLERELVALLDARARAEELQAEVSAQTRDLAGRLVGSGLTMRDVGQLLGLSHQRVAQLVNDPQPVDE